MIKLIAYPNPKIAFLLDGTSEITFSFKKLDLEQLQELQDKELEIAIKKFRPKRTKTQNSYMWELISKIAEKTHIGTTECYRNYIREFGQRDYIALKLEHTERFIRDWSENGIGFFAEDLGESKLDGFSKIVIYYGSHTYTTEEMARIIDAIVQDCNELNIETMSKEEIMALASNIK